MNGHTDARAELVYTPVMRIGVASVLLASVLCACADDGDEDTGADDTSTTVPVTTADSSSDGGTTGPGFACDANTEMVLADGVELGAQSVQAVRLEVGEDVQYTVTIAGDPAGSTQLDLVFYGLPVQGMEYALTGVMQIGFPHAILMPGTAVDFVGGTITYDLVGTTDGDPLGLEFEAEFMQGTIAGCVQTELTIETG